MQSAHSFAFLACLSLALGQTIYTAE